MTIADYIRRDLAHRIRTGAGLPERLTLGVLAGEYGVSATPVRHALGELATEGLVERLPNGRFALTKSRRRACGAKPEPPASLADAVGREVLLMGLRGEREFVREESFAERFGVGRTRLRRVLHGLAGGGLVEHVPRRGWRVRPFSHADMRAFIDVRATLEAEALDLARERLVGADLDRFIAGNGPEAVAAEELDNGLHAYFIEKAGNHYIAAFFASHGRYYARLFDHAAIDADALGEMAAQHVEILEHAKARRWARARAALRHHIHSQAPVLGAVIDRLETAVDTARTK